MSLVTQDKTAYTLVTQDKTAYTLVTQDKTGYTLVTQDLSHKTRQATHHTTQASIYPSHDKTHTHKRVYTPHSTHTQESVDPTQHTHTRECTPHTAQDTGT